MLRLKLLRFFKRHWGFAFLVILSMAGVISNYKSNMWLLGWDNFSVNVDLPVNLGRTFWATWRDSRGLGVPSDSEVVDIFRQLLFVAFDVLLPKNNLITFYYLILYVTGILSTYWLIRIILTRCLRSPKPWLLELSSTLGAIWYGFNFHAFETFFLPISMYVTRFALFPLFLLVFLHVLLDAKKSIGWWIGFALISFMVSTSYLTATVFFTLLIILGLIAVSYPAKIKRFIGLLFFFLALNAFWLFPFANYYLQKADLIPLASSFISVNESLLNKPSSVFSWQQILTFFPEILSPQSLPFRNITTNQPESVHPLAQIELRQNVRLLVSLLLPVVIAFIGVALLMVNGWRKLGLQGAWVVLLIVSMIFLLSREYSVLGWLYEWLDNSIPLFEIVFRFGSAKFSPLLLLGLVIAFSYGLYAITNWFLNKLPKKIGVPIIVANCLLLGFVVLSPFTSMISGRLFSFLVLTDLPDGYQKVADTINQDPDYYRVIHLPFDEFSYWRSYSWGYMGSAFFNFMLDKPLIDRTFEPASLENDYFFLAMTRLIRNSSLGSPDDLQSRVLETYRLLQKTGTKYIVFDETVGPELTSRGLMAWGVFHERDTRLLVDQLESQGYLSRIQTENIDGSILQLYEVKDVDSVVVSIPSATNIDPTLENTFISPILLREQHIIQTNQNPAVLYPFWQPKRQATIEAQSVKFSQTIDQVGEQFSVAQASISAGESVPVNIQIAEGDDGVRLKIHPVVLGSPTTQVKETQVTIPAEVIEAIETIPAYPTRRLSNWQILPFEKNNGLRLLIGGQILPIPQRLTSEYQPLATVLVSSEDTEIALLAVEEDREPISPDLIQLTEDPNCFGDKMAGYRSSLDYRASSITLTTTNGMTCLSTPLVVDNPLNQVISDRLFELEMSFKADSSFMGSESLLKGMNRWQKSIHAEIDKAKNYQTLSLCMLDENGDCLNARQWLVGNQSATVVIPAERMSTALQTQLLIVLPAGQAEENSLEISSLKFSTFIPIWHEHVDIESLQPLPAQTFSTRDHLLQMEIPIVLTSSTYIFNPSLDGLAGYTGNCQSSDGYRRVVTAGKWPVLSYLENCFQGLSVSLPVNPSNFYVWLTNYFVFMGKQPQFIARQQTEWNNEYLSRFTGYPFLPGFGQLEMADSPFLSESEYYHAVSSILEQAVPITTFTTVKPPGNVSRQEAVWEISQHSEGQSLIGVSSFNVLELPQYWRDLELQSEGSQRNFGTVDIIGAEQILPSLWKITFQADALHDQPILIKFGQAFDAQWQLFAASSHWEAVLGTTPPIGEKVRVDGWSNGWVLKPEELDELDIVTVYAFYTPERLAILGWTVTGLTLLVVVGMILFKSRKTS